MVIMMTYHMGWRLQMIAIHTDERLLDGGAVVEIPSSSVVPSLVVVYDGGWW